MRTALLVLVVGPALALGEDADVDLRPSFVEGRVLRYTLDQKTSTKAGTLEQVVSMKTDCELETVSSSGDGAACALRYTDASLILANPRGTLSYDTRSPDAPGSHPLVGNFLRVFVGETLELTFRPSGEVKEIRGLDAIREAPAAAFLRGFLEDEIFERTFSKLVTPAGEKRAAKVGDTWETEEVTDFDATTQLVSVLELELDEAADATATISIDGRAEFRAAPAEGGGGDADGGGEARPSVYRVESCDVDGTIEWDRERRIVRRYDLTIDLAFSGPGSGPDGKRERFSVSQVSRTRLREETAEEPPSEAGSDDEDTTTRGAAGSARPR